MDHIKVLYSIKLGNLEIKIYVPNETLFHSIVLMIVRVPNS